MVDDIVIPKKQYKESANTELLIKALKKRKGEATLGDLVVDTGLPNLQIEETLRIMLRDYRGHISATENGELLYSFNPSFSTTDAMVELRKTLKAIADVVWKVFVISFKVSIMVVLVFYVILYTIILLAIMFGGKGSSRRSGRGGSFIFVDFGRIFWYPGKRKKIDKKKGRPFYDKIFAFVFGEEESAKDKLAGEKEILNYIRQNKGRITAADLAMLNGWTMEQADQAATRLMVDYGADAIATDEGSVIYTFDNIMPTLNKKTKPNPIKYCWEKLEQMIPFNKNSGGTNFLIGALNGFNIFMSSLFVFFPVQMITLLAKKARGFPIGPELLIPIAAFGLGFSALFFTIPIVRRMVEFTKNKKILKRNIFKITLKEIYHHIKDKIYLRTVTPQMQKHLGHSLSKNEVRAIMKKMAIDYEAEIDSDNKGIYYVFPKLALELEEVHKERIKTTGEEFDVGEIAYSSKDHLTVDEDLDALDALDDDGLLTD